jgi:hypothetical protein
VISASLSRRLVSMSPGALLLYAILLVALCIHRTDLDPTYHFISEYALGPTSFLMATGLGLLSLAAGALAMAFTPMRPRSVSATVRFGLPALLSAGTVVESAFPMDAPGNQPTWTGAVHVLDAQVNFLSAFASSLCLAVSYRADYRWKFFFPLAAASSVAILASFVGMIVALESNSVYGLANLLLALTIWLWLFLTASQLRRLLRQPHVPSTQS